MEAAGIRPAMVATIEAVPEAPIREDITGTRVPETGMEGISSCEDPGFKSPPQAASGYRAACVTAELRCNQTGAGLS